jgi:hypothetical protein
MQLYLRETCSGMKRHHVEVGGGILARRRHRHAELERKKVELLVFVDEPQFDQRVAEPFAGVFLMVERFF